MFSLQIVDSDAFLDMPASSQLLYFHLSMRADDDGFLGNHKKIMRMIGAGDDDMKVLLAKRFVLSFKSGVIVIKHWKMHNYIQNDRYHETQYKDEKNGLIVKDNGSYTECIQDVSKMEAEVRLELGKDRLGKVSLEREGNTPSEEAKDFFNGGKTFTDLLILFSKESSRTEDFLKGEFDKFVLYWTERNKSGTKQRWEQQDTFEVKRRLFTWLGKVNNFDRNKTTKIL